MKVFAAVVTYNRLALLQQCVANLLSQSRSPDAVLLVDNASTDGTEDWIRSMAPTDERIHSFRLSENTGGAGGFRFAIETAVSRGADWIWIMDDDAAPHPDALDELLKVASDPGAIYGSLAVSGDQTSWLTTLLDPSPRVAASANEVPLLARVQSLPFLGFMINRELVQRIGLPDAGYFIAADDIEYCIRADRAGAPIYIAGASRIEHPASDRYTAKVLGRDIVCLRLPPWKRYYDTRNRLLIARKHYGFRLFTSTIPGSFVRLAAALFNEPRPVAQAWAFLCGFVDGIAGRKGRLHTRWRIS